VHGKVGESVSKRYNPATVTPPLPFRKLTITTCDNFARTGLGPEPGGGAGNPIRCSWRTCCNPCRLSSRSLFLERSTEPRSSSEYVVEDSDDCVRQVRRARAAEAVISSEISDKSPCDLLGDPMGENNGANPGNTRSRSPRHMSRIRQSVFENRRFQK